MPNDVIRREIEKSYALRLADKPEEQMAGPARSYSLVNGSGRLGFISPMSHHFCHQCNRLRLMADGHLRACLLSDTEMDMKEYLRAGCNDDVIESIIQGVISRKPLAHGVSPDGSSPRKCARAMQTIGG
jgi:cyclic pyranopterin phosphate synthase